MTEFINEYFNMNMQKEDTKNFSHGISTREIEKSSAYSLIVKSFHKVSLLQR